MLFYTNPFCVILELLYIGVLKLTEFSINNLTYIYDKEYRLRAMTTLTHAFNQTTKLPSINLTITISTLH